jgi:hypothetical protein
MCVCVFINQSTSQISNVNLPWWTYDNIYLANVAAHYLGILLRTQEITGQNIRPETVWSDGGFVVLLSRYKFWDSSYLKLYNEQIKSFPIH